MKIILSLIHLLIGIVLFVIGFSVLKDNWKIPSLLLLGFGMIEISIGIGLYLGRRWVKWLIGLMILCASLNAIILLAGSILWPESFAGIVILIYTIFMMLEIFSWIQVRRLTSSSS